jgi:hypothetical protein
MESVHRLRTSARARQAEEGQREKESGRSESVGQPDRPEKVGRETAAKAPVTQP